MLTRWLESISIRQGLGTLRKVELFNALDALYKTGSRVYHTMEHIGQCLDAYKEYCAVAPANIEIVMALWCHDAIYDITRSDNEKRSAKLAEEMCSELAIFAPRIEELVLLTRHDKTPDDEIGKLLTDIDLSILGQSYKVYRGYQEKIYKEYDAASRWKEFAEKRIPILESLLNRNEGRIYFTDYFYKKCGKDAFTNIHRELIELKEKLKTNTKFGES